MHLLRWSHADRLGIGIPFVLFLVLFIALLPSAGSAWQANIAAIATVKHVDTVTACTVGGYYLSWHGPVPAGQTPYLQAISSAAGAPSVIFPADAEFNSPSRAAMIAWSCLSGTMPLLMEHGTSYRATGIHVFVPCATPRTSVNTLIAIKLQKDICGYIVIEDGVWLGRGTIIVGRPEGVTIGRGSIIGANSVVSRSVPPMEVWGGVPAHFLRKR